MDEELGFNWMPIGLVAGLAAGLSLFLIFQPDPISPPPNDATYGCYVAQGAPNIRLDPAGMHIEQVGFATVDYHLERHKTGITIVVEKPIDAQLIERSVRFSVASEGEGKFLRFFRDGGDTRYGIFDGDNLKNFEFLMNDGDYLLYRKTTSDFCRNSVN